MKLKSYVPLQMALTLVIAIVISNSLSSFTTPSASAFYLAEAGEVKPVAPTEGKSGIDTPDSPQGTGFTYQGRLMSGGVPADGQFDFQFKLYDASVSGNQVGIHILPNRIVDDGLFTVTLSFGSAAFKGDARWLEIAVAPAGSGSYTTLTPRQPLTSVPYALYSKSAESAESMSWSGVYDRPFNFSRERKPNTITSFGGGGLNTTGTHSSLTIGGDGLGLISYYDSFLGDLKVAHCVNIECTDVTISTVDGSANNVGRYSAITIGRDGLGIISYYDATAGNLKAAHCDNADCSSSTTATIDNSANDVGMHTSVTIGIDGNGLISYYDATAGDLKVAHCNNPQCLSAGKATLQSPNDIGRDTSIIVNVEGRAVISHYDATGQDMLMARCLDAACATLSSGGGDLYEETGPYTSIANGIDGRPIVSYYCASDFNLKFLRCGDPKCTGPGTTQWIEFVQAPQRSSIAIGVDGLPMITYYDNADGDLKLAYCRELNCSVFTTMVLDSGNGEDVGQYSSLTVGVDGLPLVSYYDVTNGALKVLHCGSPHCVPYLQPR